MDIWITFHNNSQMANNLVKWWKTKFLNGYKQFSVECGDSKVSDTEELLGKVGSEDTISEKLDNCSTPPPLQPPEQPDTPIPTEEESTPKKQHHFNFEEFSCDVAVENTNNKCGQDRQEFSFTLYDFDGHGKITKDDIAGLVTTIYEALGSSVKVPHYGSKTIKVKLTVSPDQRKQMSATIINQGDDNQPDDDNKTKNEVHYKRDLNVTIRQRTNRRKHCKKQSNKQKSKKTAAPRAHHHCCSNKQNDDDVFVSDDDSSDAGSRLSSSDDDERECSDNEQTTRVKKCQKNTKYTIPNILIKDTCNEEVCSKMRAIKKRSGSLQRQELLEIIQANMDKNNLSFQTMRKHSKHVGAEVKKARHNHHHKTSQKMSTSPLQYLATIVDPTHFYVDLASLQNTTQLPQTHCQYDKLINAVMCVSNKTSCVKKPLKCSRKYSRVQNPVHYQLLQYPTIDDDENAKKRRFISAGGGGGPKTAHFETENGTGGVHATLSPHHLRHRNRQEDQARAMSQVVRWLEQEFSSNLHASGKTHDFKKKPNHFSHSSHKEKTNSSAPPPNSGGVERHEHHHVHEHIHHHYHHYPETTPLVV